MCFESNYAARSRGNVERDNPKIQEGDEADGSVADMRGALCGSLPLARVVVGTPCALTDSDITCMGKRSHGILLARHRGTSLDPQHVSG